MNLKGPALRAVIEINPSALEAAAVLDDERKLYGAHSLMHGIPVLLKVGFCESTCHTADKIQTGQHRYTSVRRLIGRLLCMSIT